MRALLYNEGLVTGQCDTCIRASLILKYNENLRQGNDDCQLSINIQYSAILQEETTSEETETLLFKESNGNNLNILFTNNSPEK